jgi:hypothetical protein
MIRGRQAAAALAGPTARTRDTHALSSPPAAAIFTAATHSAQKKQSSPAALAAGVSAAAVANTLLPLAAVAGEVTPSLRCAGRRVCAAECCCVRVRCWTGGGSGLQHVAQPQPTSAARRSAAEWVRAGAGGCRCRCWVSAGAAPGASVLSRSRARGVAAQGSRELCAVCAGGG